MNESRAISLIQTARIASPCDMKWEDMTGDDRVRHCDACDFNVYDFAAMTEDEANALLANAEGRVCGRIWRRADGTVITRDCPVGLRVVRRKMILSTAKVAAASLVIFSAISYGRSRKSGLSSDANSTYTQTKTRIETWLNGAPPPMPGQILLGDIVYSPQPPALPVNQIK